MTIPKVIFQTSINKQPEYVVKQIKKYAPSWEYKHFTDKEIIQYFINNPIEEFPFVLNLFHRLNYGAHKADLFRYYYLYLEGGVFIDSDAMIQMDIERITKDYEFFSVNSYIKGTVFQGFIGCNAKNPIIYESLKDVYHINMNELKMNYHLLTKNMYFIIKNGNYDFKYKLYNELESDKEKAITINDENEYILIHYWNTKKIPEIIVPNNILDINMDICME